MAAKLIFNGLSREVGKSEDREITGAAMEVLNALKPGLDEKLYERALILELESRGDAICCQKRFRVTWWSTPHKSAGDAAVYGLHVIHRTPPIGTLPVN